MRLTNFCLFFILLFSISCGSDTTTDQLTQAREAFNATPDGKTGRTLLETLLANVPTEKEAAITHLAEAAGVYHKVSDQLNTGGNEKILLSMKGHSTTISEGIETLSTGMYNEEQHQLDKDKANNFINMSQVYYMIQPNDAKSPTYLFKAAETARALRNFGKAIELYDVIYERFTGYEKHAQTLFLKAFTLDNDLKRHDEAKGYYELFLKKYPDNDFADDTEFLLANLGKSDEEIIKKFEEQ